MQHSPIWLRRVPGLFLTLVLSVLALQIHTLPFAPFTIDAPKPHPIDQILIVVILGILVRHFIPLPVWCKEGIQYAIKGLLPIGIILLGAKLNFFHVVQVSLQSLLISTICVIVALCFTYWLCLKAGIARRLGFLIGVGTAICGGTAIVIMAPVIEAEENETAMSVAVVTLFGMLAIFVFPLLGSLLEMTQVDFGIWTGIAVHATPQVLAAGFAYGNEAGEISTIVKLVRVLMLAPLTLIVTLWYARYQRANQQVYLGNKTKLTTLLPPFIFGFLLMAIANTFYFLPEITFHLQENLIWQAGTHHVNPIEVLTTIAGILITMAMAGVGLGTDLKSVQKTGFAPLYIGLFAAIVLSVFSLILIELFV